MTQTVLQTRNLRKSFGALLATDDVSLDLRQGEIHAVIGPNGAGKSTLIAQISGGLRPDAGTVQIGGKDVTQDSAQTRARHGLARTFQISQLAMEDTVLENAVLGVIGHVSSPWRFLKPALRDTGLKDAAMQALGRVGLQDAALMRTSALSHGQRRQLEVALALTLNPKAFVMDEPMAGLGADGSKALTAVLDQLRDQAPILLVEHDMDAVFALADRISVLVYGRIIATGTVSEIKGNRDVQDAYLGTGE